MTETANLEIRVDATSGERAKVTLDELAKAGGRAEGAVESLGVDMRAAMGAANAFGTAVDDAAGAEARLAREADKAAAAVAQQGAMARQATAHFDTMYDAAERDFSTQWVGQQVKIQKAGKLTSAEMLNLGRQFSDVGVSIASGMPIWMVAIQQGAQIQDTFALAAARGVGFKAVMGELIGVAGGLAAVLAPIAIVVGGLGLGFAVAAKEINDANGDMIGGLGLTEEQLKKVKNESVTMGDVMTGVFNATAKGLSSAFGPEIDATKSFFADMYRQTVDGAVRATEVYVGAYVGAFEAIKATWKMLPAAIGDAAYSAANAVIAATESMINKAIEAINKLRPALNIAAKMMGQAFEVPELDQVSLGRLENRFAGGMTRIGETGMSAFSRGMQRGRAMVQAAGDAIVAETLAAWEKRVRAEAGDPKKDRDGGAKKAIDEEKKALEELERAAQGFIDRAATPFEKHQKMMAEATKVLTQAVEKGLIPLTLALNTLERLSTLDVANNIRKIEQSFTKIALPKFDPEGQAFEKMIANLRAIDRAAAEAARGMERSFGRVGGALGGLMDSFSMFRVEQAQIAADRNKDLLTQEEATAKLGVLQIRTYGDMAEAAKGFFKEGSTGWKAMQVVEQGYRLWQFAASIQAMAQQSAETATVVAQSGVRGSAKAAEGAAGIFAALGPFGFPVVAAMVAVLAAMGLKGLGGGGGGVSIPTSEERQETQGTGSVLGDATAKSDSISRSLEIVAANSNKDLEYSNRMLASLRAIEGSIGAVASLLSRQLSVGGALNTDDLGLGSKASGNFLYGSSKSVTLNDQGLDFVAQTVGQIIADGVVGQTYQEIITQSKKKILGLTISSKTNVTTNTADLDGELAGEIQRLVGALRAGILDAAAILGVEGAEATLDAFTVNLGKISLAGLSGAEIEAELNAVFGKLGDDLAAAALPFLGELQKVGEGAFETLARVARQYQVLDISLQAMGMTFNGVGVSSLAARERLVSLMGGIDQLAEQTAYFTENFLTEAERMAPIQAAVNAELARLGVAGVTTKDQFADLVRGLDVSTAAGAELFAALMAVAPAFAKVADYAADLAEEQERLAEAAAEAAAAEAERTAALVAARRDMAISIQELTDPTGARNARRQITLEGITDAELRALTEEFYRLSDALEASRTAAEAAATAAEAAARAAEAEAQRQAQIASTRQGLEIALLKATGQELAATNMERAIEIARLTALDPALAAIQQQIYGAIDANAAAAAAQLAAAEAARAAEEAQREAQRQAEAAARAAEQAAREQEQRINQARNALSQAYEREASAITATRDRMRELGQTLRNVQRDLTYGPMAALSPEAAYGAAAAQFRDVAARAQGDADAAAALPAAIEAFIGASRSYNASSPSFFADLAEAQAAVASAIAYTDTQADIAQLQLDQLTSMVGGIIDLNRNVLTVAQAIADLRQEMAGVQATMQAANDQQAAIADRQFRFEAQQVSEAERTRRAAQAAA